VTSSEEIIDSLLGASFLLLDLIEITDFCDESFILMISLCGFSRMATSLEFMRPISVGGEKS
jgi:hypothetical protein